LFADSRFLITSLVDPPHFEMAAAAETERTKYKAIVRYTHETVMRAYGKDPEEVKFSPEKINSIARIAEISAMNPTRPDRRFPNTNQANNCWFVTALVANGRLEFL
jgi:hypothetical protein